MPYISESERKVLDELIGQKINIELEEKYDTFHNDDIDHGELKKLKHEGILCKILEDGLIITGTGFPRIYWKDGVEQYISFERTGRGYFPFNQNIKTHLSETTRRIALITHNNELIYKR